MPAEVAELLQHARGSPAATRPRPRSAAPAPRARAWGCPPRPASPAARSARRSGRCSPGARRPTAATRSSSVPVASTFTGRRCDATLGMPPSGERLRSRRADSARSTISPSTARHRSDGSGPAHTTTSRPSRPALDRDLRPRDLPRHAVDEVDGGAGLLEVHEIGEVDAREGADRFDLLLEHRDAAAAREARRRPSPTTRRPAPGRAVVGASRSRSSPQP